MHVGNSASNINTNSNDNSNNSSRKSSNSNNNSCRARRRGKTLKLLAEEALWAARRGVSAVPERKEIIPLRRAMAALSYSAAPALSAVSVCVHAVVQLDCTPIRVDSMIYPTYQLIIYHIYSGSVPSSAHGSRVDLHELDKGSAIYLGCSAPRASTLSIASSRGSSGGSAPPSPCHTPPSSPRHGIRR